jgi:hypothetical protein
MSNQTSELGKWLDAHLRGRKYPFRVRYAPERTDRSSRDPVILIARDTMASEKIESAHGTQKNGRKMRTRRIPVVVKIFAKSSLDGARLEDHEELADYLVDAMITALEVWSTSEKGGGIEYVEMSFLTPDELVTSDGKPEGWPGVVYLMRFTIGRGVIELDYLKQVLPTAPINGVGSTVEVRQFDEDGEPGNPAVQPPH